VEDDAGAGVGGGHPPAAGEVGGGDVVACELESGGLVPLLRVWGTREWARAGGRIGGYGLLSLARLLAGRTGCLRLRRSLRGNWVLSSLRMESLVNHAEVAGGDGVRYNLRDSPLGNRMLGWRLAA